MEPPAKTADNFNKLRNGGGEVENQKFSYAMQLVTSVSLPLVLMSSIRLGLFDIIAGAGPKTQLSPAQIASHLSSPTTIHNLNPSPNGNDHTMNGRGRGSADITAGMLDRMMRLLASHSVLTCSSIEGGDNGGSRRVYGLAPVAEYFVRNNRGASLGPFLDLVNDTVTTMCW